MSVLLPAYFDLNNRALNGSVLVTIHQKNPDSCIERFKKCSSSEGEPQAVASSRQLIARLQELQ